MIWVEEFFLPKRCSFAPMGLISSLDLVSLRLISLYSSCSYTSTKQIFRIQKAILFICSQFWDRNACFRKWETTDRVRQGRGFSYSDYQWKLMTWTFWSFTTVRKVTCSLKFSGQLNSSPLIARLPKSKSSSFLSFYWFSGSSLPHEYTQLGSITEVPRNLIDPYTLVSILQYEKWKYQLVFM